MTAYRINRLCWGLDEDEDLAERLLADPAGELARWGLTAEERAAFVAGDVAALYRLGGHPFLLQYLSRHGLFGLNRDVYQQRIKTAAPQLQ